MSLFAIEIGKNPHIFTKNVKEMLYTGQGKIREVERSKDIFRQLYCSKLLATLVMSVPCK